MRLLHTGDLHLTEGPRFEDSLRVLEALVEDGIEQRVQLWLIGGDLTGTTVPHKATPAERNALAAIFQAMGATAPVVIIAGNHDYPGDLEIYGRLESRNPIVVFDRPNVLGLGVLGGAVYALPYPTKRWLLAGADVQGIEAQNALSADGLRAILLDWRQRVAAEPSVPHILLSHINIGGSHVAGGEVMIGREIELSPHDLDELGMDYAALSHIHLHQQMASRAWYAGSPDAHNFGESDQKGWLVVDVDHGKDPIIHRRVSPARAFVTVDALWRESGGEWAWSSSEFHGARLYDHIAEAVAKGAEVRLRLEIPEEHAATIADTELIDMLKAGGAHVVKIERRVIPKVRVRSEAIATARTTAEKVEAYWQSLGAAAPATEARGRALAKLADLESGEVI